MNTSRRSIAGVALAVAVLALPARAEVSAQSDAFGRYLRTVIVANASTRSPRIWTVARPRFGSTPLNPQGDASGDQLPTVLENPAQQRWPWAIWSRFNGQDYDLVWSRWLGTTWAPIAPVDASPAAGDDVDPALAFGPDGRAHAVWLVRGSGPARVELSIFLATEWMAPFQVSDPGEDAANPTVRVLPNGRIAVAYDTAAGRVTKIVAFARPATITDDTSPMTSVSVTSSSTESAVTKP